MKNSVMVPLVFAVGCIVCLALLSVSGALADYGAFTALLKGESGFFLTAVLDRALSLCPLACMIALLSVFMYLMRHRSFVIVSVILVAVLAACTVVFAIPLSCRLHDRLDGRIAAARRYTEAHTGGLLASGTIHRDAGKIRFVWFDVSPNGTGVSPLILADSGAQPGSVSLSVHENARFDPLSGTLSDDTGERVSGAGKDRDPVRAKLAPPSFISSIGRDAVRLLDDFRHALARGRVAYLATAGSFFLAVCVLWALCYATGWRLLNAILVVAAFRGLLFCWPYAFSGPVHDVARRLLPAAVPEWMFGPLFCVAFSALTLLVGGAVMLRRLLHRRKAGGGL